MASARVSHRVLEKYPDLSINMVFDGMVWHPLSALSDFDYEFRRKGKLFFTFPTKIVHIKYPIGLEKFWYICKKRGNNSNLFLKYISHIFAKRKRYL